MDSTPSLPPDDNSAEAAEIEGFWVAEENERREAEWRTKALRRRDRIVTEGHWSTFNPRFAARPRLAKLADQLFLYEDMLATADGRTFPISGDTAASVEHTGGVAVTRGRDLAAKAAAGLVDPVAMLFIGNAQERVHDSRLDYLTIQGDDWTFTAACGPDHALAVREFAGAVSGLARKKAAAAASSPATEPDPLEQIERLARLMDSGALTQEEFDQQKTRLLRKLGSE